MKIAFFADSYKPYTSGVVHSIETFREELESLGHDIYIFAPSYPNYKPLLAEEKVFRFPSISAPTNKDFALAIPFSGHLEKNLSNWRPDIVHVHSPFALGSFGAKYARRLNIPLVFTFHTLYEEYVHYFPFARKAVKKITQIYARNYCNRCDIVVVPTLVVKEYLRQIGVQVPVENVPTGIKLDEYRFPDKKWLKKHYGIPEKDKVLLFVGRLGQEKNIDFLLEAFIQLKYEFPNITLVLVGSGPEEKMLRTKVAREKLEKSVIFAGKIPKEEVAKYYAGADLFVFSSVTETQGLVIPEAKAAGLPVVAVKANGVSEMVIDGEDGFLTQINKDDFVNKIAVLLSDDELRGKFALRARTNSELLSSQNCALRLLKVYGTVASRK